MIILNQKSDQYYKKEIFKDIMIKSEIIKDIFKIRKVK